MSSPAREDRIAKLIEVAEALREGRFGVDVPGDAGGDDVGRLGAAMKGLSLSLERRWREVEELDLVSNRVSAGVLLDEVLEEFYREAKGIFPYDRIGISLLEDGGRTLRARWAKSSLGPLRLGGGYAAPMEGSSLEEILATGRPRILNDLCAYLAARPSSASTRLVVEEGVRSSLTCPLVAGGVPIGFLFFSSALTGAYADAHVGAYQRIAGQLSVLVEKARLVSELSAQKGALEVRNAFITRIFGRYLSESVVERLLETPDGLRLGGERRVVTVLMSDLRGFTPMVERLPPERVVSLLNIHLGAMTDVVLRHGGTIDEFIGDAILAIFGAPLAHEDDACRALACAVEMQQAMEGVNERARALSLPEMRMGVGVHTGEVVVGNIGSERRTKYGVVGAAINLASRIQGFTLGGQVLASEETVRAAGHSIEAGARFTVHPKGVREPVAIAEILGVGEARLPPASDPLEPLESPVAVEVESLEPGPVPSSSGPGLLHAVGRWEAALETVVPLQPLDEIVLRLPGGIEVRAVAVGAAGRGTAVRVRFRSLPDEASRLFSLFSSTGGYRRSGAPAHGDGPAGR